MTDEIDDRLEERLVTFSMEYHGCTVVIENVPARVDPQTGEEFFSPDTVERLQAIVWSQEPDRESETPVFQFAA
jgi:YgiT-type zinc finger domain-containing protein